MATSTACYADLALKYPMPSTTPLRLLHAHGNVNGGVLGDSVQTRLQFLHEVARRRFEFIDRIAMALYDPAQDLLKTFASSDGPGQPLVRYEAHQADVPSLRDLATQRRARVVDDIAAGLAPGHSVHGQWLSSQRYRSSYTRPVFHGEELAAFLFFDSRQPAAFNAEVTGFLELFADLVAQAYLARLAAARTLIGSINLACGLAGQRDSETGQHLRRIGLFSRLIARRMAPAWQLGDEFIEYLYLFAPLHDIGKIGIPDRILQKPGRLDEAELALM
ncbi:MAG: hypothetical protein RL722_2034, partial [Pseudomonadota bacterium]